MKISPQRIVRCLTAFTVVCMVLVSALVTPVKAVLPPGFVAFQPKHYISGVSIDGDVKTVTYSFSGTDAYFLTVNNGVTSSFKGVSYSHSPAVGSTKSDINIYPLNDRPSLYYALSENTIDVSDLVPGAIIEFSLTLSYRLEYWASPNSFLAQMRSCVCCYDSDGKYIGQVVGDWAYRSIITSSEGESSSYDVKSSVTLPSGTAYISPYLNTSLTYGNFPGGDGAIDIYTGNLILVTDVNMLEDSSETMHAVKDSLDDISDKMDGVSDKLDDVTGVLGDIDSGIGDVSDKLDDVTGELVDIGDKVDEIITGGEPGKELEDKTPVLDSAGDRLSSALDDYSDAVSSVPTIPADVGSLVDKGRVSDSKKVASSFLDWESSGLSKMFVPLSISCTFCLLFYIIFGKKG